MPTCAELYNIDPSTLTEEELDRVISKFQRYRELKEKAQNNAEQDFYLQKERMKIKLKLNDNIPQMEYEEMDELKEKLKDLKKSQDPKHTAFITINPKENTLEGFKELSKKVEKCISKHWIQDYAYCYEQRSTDANDIHGLHAHILLTRNIKPSHLEREVRSTFKSVVGIPDKHINIQWKRKEWIKDKYEYMLGNKTGEGKDLKTPIDDIMRKSLGIEKIYTSENFFLLL